MRLTLTILLASLLAGCATMNQEECLHADWQENGYNDGAAGEGAEPLQNRREACARYGIVPDAEAYREGYEHGLEDFCTTDNGYERGRRGYKYRGICPPGREGLFLLGYNEGRVIYELEQRLEEYESAINERARQLDRIAYQNYHDQNILASKDATDAERQQALARIRYRERQVYFLRQELFNLRQYHQDLSHQFMQLAPRGWGR